ncbi:verrucotoxin subunit beta-like isoform X3 [Daphnia pulicaria]|uniref:verrucotoxin subunit beta-like isoform X3 n=1 Tax=Daphnia pulicaria TaxID=35523 RepID=UPI001EEA32DB|nr:verrucotoxin subunit beta-like isoform X3 [Daphnia pulicaria]
MSSSDISRQTFEMPALGRHFSLGTVYDAVRDKTIPGFTFWNGSDLKNVKSTGNAYTEFSIIASDKLTDKFQELKFNGSLQVSILCGQIELGGSANYLNKKKSTSRESSVHLTLQRRTAVKELLMEQLDESNMRYPQIQRSGRIGTATHIVTQIQYGAEATFTFTKKRNETEDEQEVNGQLKLGAEQFTKFLKGNANVGGNQADNNRENENNIECHFQGNFELPSNVDRPTTYKEAIEFAKKFLQFSSDWMAKDPANGNQPLGVPISVWLYPLVLMQDAQDAPALRYEISLTLASQCVGIMENYGEVEDELRFMLEDPLVKKLNPLQKKLQLFQRCLASFIAELKRKLGEMVVGIRSGQDSAADSFRQLTSRITNEQFPFNFNRLDRWLDQKHKELCIIRRFQDEAKNKLGNQSKVLFFPSARTLQQQMTKFPVDFGFEFSFSPLALSEPLLELLNQTLGTNYFNEISLPTINLNLVLWYENSSVIERIQKEIDLFVKLVNAKSKDEKFTFVIAAPDEYNETCANQFSIIFHHKQKRILGWDAVLTACQHYPKERIVDVIRLLVEEEIDETWNAIPFLALCRYYKKDNLIDIVRSLIEKNIDVHCKQNDGWNALLILCRNYDKENLIDIVRSLIEKNIDVHCKQNDGWNALLILCRNYDKENLIDIVRLFIEKNIDVNCKNNNGWNALLILCRNYDKENLIDIVRLLIGKNIDVNCRINDGDNALTLLCQFYKKENLLGIIRLLIEKNIDVNCKTNNGWNALHLVCRYAPKTNLVDLVSILVLHKIDKKVKTTGSEIGTARSFLLKRFKEEEIANILQMLDS